MKLKHILFTLASLAFFSTAQAQVKVGANPSTIGTNSALEVEATNGNKTIVNKTNGQVTIQDGTQGADKVLTSDANGNASWKSFSEAKVPTVVFIGGNDAQLVVSASTAGAVASRIPINPVASYAASWNSAQRAFVVPVAGYYRVEFISQTSVTASTGNIIVVLRGKLAPSYNEQFGTLSYGTRTLVETAYYNAGDLIYAHVWDSTTGNGYVYKSNMNITYIPQ